MDLRTWRTNLKLSQSACAAALALAGGARSYQRIETGENGADADLVARILILTGGQVSTEDMHQVRLNWLKGNRPQRFDVPEVVPLLPEAAE